MTQAPIDPASAGIDPARVWAALAEVADPELPPVSVVDLGVVGGVDVNGRRVRVRLLPTFVGCPAIELMRAAVAERLARLGAEPEVVVSFAEPWTSDRITTDGRRKLRAAGIAPPAPGDGRQRPLFSDIPVRGRSEPVTPGSPGDAGPAAARCPYCGSADTSLESLFGATACRTVWYCTGCRQPFEQFKTV